MTSSIAVPLSIRLPGRPPVRNHPLFERYAPIITVVLALIAIWYVAAVLMNMTLVRDAFEREETPYAVSDLIEGTLSAERPLLPAPHQVISAFVDSVFGYPINAPRSLVYHSGVTLSATLLGFVMGALLGVALALSIVHSAVLEKSLLPWIICSQMVPILALAPIFIVVLGALGLHGPVAEVDHLGLSVLLSGHHRHGEGIYLARPDATRPDADLVGDATAGAGKAALAVGGAVSVRQPQGRHHHFADRRHRRRTADRRRGRHPGRGCWPAPITARPSRSGPPCWQLPSLPPT